MNLETLSGAPLGRSDHERALRDGATGEAMRFAMQLVVRAARLTEAPRLLEIGGQQLICMPRLA